MFSIDTAYGTLSGQYQPALAPWLVGKHFVFNPGSAGEPEPSVVFLGVPGTFCRQVPVLVRPTPPKLPPIRAVFSDKMLYREGDDTVHIAVHAPGLRSASLVLLLNGEKVATPTVELDKNGLGIYQLRDPVAGGYEVRLDESASTFIVAAYKLAPLTATLKHTEISGSSGKERLQFHAQLQTYGAPLVGMVSLTLMDLAAWPPAARGSLTLSADADGTVSGAFALEGAGPFSINAQVLGDALKTASMPLPGSRQSDREELVLSAWNQVQVARLVSFAGAEANRGLFVGDAGRREAAPVEIQRGDAGPMLRFRADTDAWCVVQVTPDGALTVQRGATLEAGYRMPLGQDAAWNVLLVGVFALGDAWEGRAIRLSAPRVVAALELPESAGPGEQIVVGVRGPPAASALVVVRDQRLQNVDTALSTTAASWRRQLEGTWPAKPSTRVLRYIQPPPPPPPMPPQMARGAGVFEGNIPLPAPAPRGPARSGGAGFAPKSASPVIARPASATPPSEGPPPAADAAPGPPTGPSRESFPDVMLATRVELDAAGEATIPVQLGDSMGTIAVDCFVASAGDWASTHAEILVTKPVFGELTLPRFVARGDHADGRLIVRVAEGSALVTVYHDEKAVLLRGPGAPTETAFVSAPGAILSFAAAAGAWVAEVRAHDQVDRSVGRVDEPGKLVWLQRAVRLVSAGEQLSAVGDVLALRILPSLDKTFDRMIGGLRSYEHGCCEQTSAVMLAAAAAYITAKSENDRRAASAHIRATIQREERMWLRGRGFKGWPDYPEEVFCYSPGATLNLLQMEMLYAFDLDNELKLGLDTCLTMARDAAAAHKISLAPSAPRSAREAYGRFSKFTEDRQRMATYIRERVEPWEKEMKAILKFELPSLTTETWHKNPAMIRAETAFGAATLIELGGTDLSRGFELANTVLGALRENGSMYSTLDSVAALTLLSALRNAGLDPSKTRVRLDGVDMTGLGAAAQTTPASRIEVLEGTAQVQVERLLVEDYTAINRGVRANVTLERDGRASTVFSPGDSVDLVISLLDPYEAGDLVHVFLPDALSWVQGGGQVKKFSLDLKGQSKIRVPLAATGQTLDAAGGPAPQHFAVCVRNMYDEERGYGRGDFEVTVRQGGGPSLGGRIASGLKKLFGAS